MKLKTWKSLTFLLIFSLGYGCASKNSEELKSQETHEKLKEQGWDHEQIRETREAEEKSLKSMPVSSAPEARDCVVLTADQMRRSKASGCFALDPREGYGENKFCCEKEYPDQ